MLHRIVFTLALMCGVFAGSLFSAQASGQKVQHASWHSTPGYLGVGVVDVDTDRAKALNLKDEHGVEVKSIAPDSPAAKAGFKEGDVVLEYNGQRVEGLEQFMRMVRETPSGRKVGLTVWRNGGTQTLSAVLSARSSQPSGLGDGFGEMPPMPPMPSIPGVQIPDIPNVVMSWRSSALGVESESLNSQLAEYFGVKEGVLVRSVVKGSPAEKAGLKAGDVIVKVDNDAVSNSRELSGMLHARHAKKNVQLTVVRNRREMPIEVRLNDLSWWLRAESDVL